MEDIVRLNFLDDREQGDQVVEVSVLKKDPVLVIGPLEKMLDIVDGAAPAADTVDVPVSVLQQVVRQVGTYHTRDAGDEGFICHKYSLFLSFYNILFSILYLKITVI